MSTFTLRRIQADINLFRAQNNPSLSIALDNEDPCHVFADLRGPAGTPYEGGVFRLEIKIPNRYPFAPPEVKFLTKIYHPNIHATTGGICLSILKDDWTATQNLHSVLISIQALLSAPNPDDPMDMEVGAHLMRNRADFANVAREWTCRYAGAASTEPGKAIAIEQVYVDRFAALGFIPEIVRDVLVNLNYVGENISNIPDEEVVDQLTARHEGGELKVD